MGVCPLVIPGAVCPIRRHDVFPPRMGEPRLTILPEMTTWDLASGILECRGVLRRDLSRLLCSQEISHGGLYTLGLRPVPPSRV